MRIAILSVLSASLLTTAPATAKFGLTPNQPPLAPVSERPNLVDDVRSPGCSYIHQDCVVVLPDGSRRIIKVPVQPLLQPLRR